MMTREMLIPREKLIRPSDAWSYDDSYKMGDRVSYGDEVYMLSYRTTGSIFISYTSDIAPNCDDNWILKGELLYISENVKESWKVQGCDDSHVVWVKRDV